jgi:hypothetical protein
MVLVLVLVLVVLMLAGGAGGVGWWCWWCGLQQQLRFAPARTRTPREAPTHLPTYPPTLTYSLHSLTATARLRVRLAPPGR